MIPRSTSMLARGIELAIAAFVLALVVIAIPLTRSIARPIEQLRLLSRELGSGNLAARAPMDRRDEIARRHPTWKATKSPPRRTRRAAMAHPAIVNAQVA